MRDRRPRITLSLHPGYARHALRKASSHNAEKHNMAFAVSSNSFKDGDYLGSAHILSADFGFGCAGGNQSPHLKWTGAPAGTHSPILKKVFSTSASSGAAGIRSASRFFA